MSDHTYGMNIDNRPIVPLLAKEAEQNDWLTNALACGAILKDFSAFQLQKCFAPAKFQRVELQDVWKCSNFNKERKYNETLNIFEEISVSSQTSYNELSNFRRFQANLALPIFPLRTKRLSYLKYSVLQQRNYNDYQSQECTTNVNLFKLWARLSLFLSLWAQTICP